MNVIGSNFISKVEIDAAAIKWAKLITVDSKEQARLEAGDFHAAITAGAFKWSEIKELGQVIVGHVPGRGQASDVTLFKSVGIAIEDVATAAKVVAKAKEKNIGKSIDW
jgi:ornithine cyclodeaminase/alanine dehydrogenase-like protein (mu-crystallin family)